MSAPNQYQRAVVMTCELIESMLTEGTDTPARRVSQGLPLGAKLVHVEMNWRRDLILYFEHESFTSSDEVVIVFDTTQENDHA